MTSSLASTSFDSSRFRPPLSYHPASAIDPVVLGLATADDREQIHRLRHEVYARELGQHQVRATGRLTDALDAHNVYLVARIGGEVVAFVSVTPPAAGAYSIDKYVARGELPFVVDAGLYEIRLLTVRLPFRGRNLATLLMYAAFRWVESHGGRHIVAIGRREVVELYQRAGMRLIGRSTQSGAVTYDFLHATVDGVREELAGFRDVLARLEARTEWTLSFPFSKPASCFHGGAFFEAVGEQFRTIERAETIINADVLDAWYPPAPSVVATLRAHLPWLLRTSPPTSCRGLIAAVAEARGVDATNILPGGGSSDLIFRALRQWLSPASRALILDPTYGEYAHVLERVIGCAVARLPLTPENNYAVELDRLEAALAERYDLVVLVNANSPTGQHIPRERLEGILRRAPATTRIWVDETYIDYAGADESLERFAVASENVIVCKSMSKIYALSGVRVAYLCAAPHQLEALRAITPPWFVSLPAQVAAVRALAEPDYYAARIAETHTYRQELAVALTELGWHVFPGVANFLLCRLPENGPTASGLAEAGRARGLFLRDAALMGARLGSHAIRIAVKDAATNRRMLEILREVYGGRRIPGANVGTGETPNETPVPLSVQEVSPTLRPGRNSSRRSR